MPNFANHCELFFRSVIGFACLWLFSLGGVASAQTPDSKSTDTDQLKKVVQAAFVAAHDGYSVDEVLLNDELQAAFQSRCRERLPDADPERCNWTLLNLRKAGDLEVKATKSREVSEGDLEPLRHVAEIAARAVQDQHRTSIDRVMASPQWKADFDAAAQKISPEVDAYLVRRAAFQLRKTRQLQPELITRLADWGREVRTYSVEELRAQPELVPEQPGIYLFRDASGYLYIGEAMDLRKRLGQHLDQSDRQSLANYLKELKSDSVTIELHTFAPDSRIKELAVRRAYESELIRSRSPRFNIRP
ncbi:MAG: GIY-YIG nuclease family protein [Planctomycetota bacterium]